MSSFLAAVEMVSTSSFFRSLRTGGGAGVVGLGLATASVVLDADAWAGAGLLTTGALALVPEAGTGLELVFAGCWAGGFALATAFPVAGLLLGTVGVLPEAAAPLVFLGGLDLAVLLEPVVGCEPGAGFFAGLCEELLGAGVVVLAVAGF